MAKKKVKTKAEKERLQTIAEMPCYACFQDGRETNAEVHHIRSQTGLGLRPSHFATIPLCPTHHRYGKVSVHLGKKAFVERYGTEQEILEKTNREIEKCKEENQVIF
ncbi:HNH endonuclease [uncultured Mediterranean phage uvMED]|nr:HNH endonuclease [uncultured Mediterranean phage uvMED]BAR20327.1 HNH endonuclease [uncultured Mediterranean phage uvMED]